MATIDESFNIFQLSGQTGDAGKDYSCLYSATNDFNESHTTFQDDDKYIKIYRSDQNPVTAQAIKIVGDNGKDGDNGESAINIIINSPFLFKENEQITFKFSCLNGSNYIQDDQAKDVIYYKIDYQDKETSTWKILAQNFGISYTTDPLSNVLKLRCRVYLRIDDSVDINYETDYICEKHVELMNTYFDNAISSQITNKVNFDYINSLTKDEELNVSNLKINSEEIDVYIKNQINNNYIQSAITRGYIQNIMGEEGSCLTLETLNVEMLNVDKQPIEDLISSQITDEVNFNYINNLTKNETLDVSNLKIKCTDLNGNYISINDIYYINHLTEKTTQDDPLNVNYLRVYDLKICDKVVSYSNQTEYSISDYIYKVMTPEEKTIYTDEELTDGDNTYNLTLKAKIYNDGRYELFYYIVITDYDDDDDGYNECLRVASYKKSGTNKNYFSSHPMYYDEESQEYHIYDSSDTNTKKYVTIYETGYE